MNRLPHPGPCSTDRRPCLRPECRERFGEYPSLEIMQSGQTVGHCHDWAGADIEEFRAKRDAERQAER